MDRQSIVEVPEIMLRSPILLHDYGFRIVDNFFDANTMSALQTEAIARYPSADPQESWAEDREEVRGGKPKRKFLSSGGGPVQDALYASSALLQILTACTGLPVQPSGNRGSYSYYVRAGDFLEVHRDILTCDIAVITALQDNTGADDPCGSTLLYPSRIGDTLSSIRARPSDGSHAVKLTPGQTIILCGGIIPHGIQPTREHQQRVVSVLCFEAMISGA